jgi:hypothetical protein
MKSKHNIHDLKVGDTVVVVRSHDKTPLQCEVTTIGHKWIHVGRANREKRYAIDGTKEDRDVYTMMAGRYERCGHFYNSVAEYNNAAEVWCYRQRLARSVDWFSKRISDETIRTIVKLTGADYAKKE